MRIWVVSELYYPEETSTGYFLTKIAEGLAQKYEVSVLCGKPSYAAKGVSTESFELHNQVKIRRLWGTTLNKDNLFFRVFNVFTFSLSILIRSLLSIKQTDTVLVVTNPPLLPYIIASVCFLKRARCILLIHDVYPEVLVATGFFKVNSFFIRWIGWLTKLLYRSVEKIIVLGRDMKALVENKLEKPDSVSVIIPNWGDVDQVFPQPRINNTQLEDLHLKDKFVIQYSGNMGRTHGVKEIVEVAAQLQTQKEFYFLFIGSGANRQWLEKQVKDDRMTNISLLSFCPRDFLSTSLNACDVAIISFLPGMKGISVPSRLYNILAAGKPVIAVADEDSELALVVKEEQIGWVVTPGCTEELSSVIQKARSNPENLIEMGKRARRTAENRYSFKQVIQAYYNLFDNLESLTDSKDRIPL